MDTLALAASGTLDPLTIVELITWVTLIPGIGLLTAGFAQRSFASKYEETWGVVIPSPAGTAYPWFRWMDLDRELQSAPVPPGADEGLAPGDEIKVYMDMRRPDRGRLDPPSADGRVLRLTGWVLIGVGAAAGIVQVIALFAT
jgi:hypothetical protein